MIKEKIAQLTNAVTPEIIALRRDFHQHPELGFEEFETGKKVANFLANLGIEVQTGVAKTGVLGVLRGGKPGPVIALRADMDALPIVEKTGAEYASTVEGKSHACGHDGHTAILLGVAKVLNELRAELPGTIKFIFQPAEEGPGGALPMIEEGVMENPHVDAIFGLHIWPTFKVGEIGISYGVQMASPDKFVLRIKGKGGHGSAPHETVDAIAVAGQIITGLQQIVSRKIDPLDPVVVTIGTISGGYRYNVIADEVEMTGTIRTLSNEVRQQIPSLIKEIVGGITSAYGATYELDYIFMYPPLINDRKMVELVMGVSKEVLGPDSVSIIEKPSMGGEDFAYFLEKVPGAFIFLGSSNSPETEFPPHNPHFDFDESIMAKGVEMFANLVFAYRG